MLVMNAPLAAKPSAWRPSRSDVEFALQTGEGIFDKLKGSMDKARMVGSRVVPHLSQNDSRHAQVSSCPQAVAFG